MKRLSGALLVLGLVLGGASCGVDKEGTAENLIKSLEDANGSELNDDQKDCLTDVVNEYSDDELKSLDNGKAGAPLIDEFTGKAYDCVVMLGS
jgi:hypothetical protein